MLSPGTAPAPHDGAETLSEVVLRLSTARGLDEVMAVVSRAVRRLLGADGATFVLHEDGRCFYADEDAISPLWKGQRFPSDICISGWVMRNGVPATIPDIYADPRIPGDIYRLTFVRSMIMVPVGRGEASAAIGAYWSRKQSLSDEQVVLLSAIGDAASVALSNVSLYQTLAVTAQQATRKAEEAERANAAKARFLAAASHDLRQPFQAMRLFQEVLNLQITDDRTRATLAKLDEAMKAGEELLRALLDVSVLDAGINRLAMEDCRLGELLAAVVAPYEETAVAKGLRLRLAGVDGMVRSERALLSRMVRNLVDNALRYTHRGGVLVAARRRGEAMRIEVWDTGIGIPEDKQTAVFEEFFQLGNPERDREKGLGLGLAIVAKTCRLLGCTVGLRSRPGKGSVFWLDVPAVADEVAAAAV